MLSGLVFGFVGVFLEDYSGFLVVCWVGLPLGQVWVFIGGFSCFWDLGFMRVLVVVWVFIGGLFCIWDLGFLRVLGVVGCLVVGLLGFCFVGWLDCSFVYSLCT